MNKQAVLEGLLFIKGDEGISLKEITNLLDVTKKTAQELLNKL